MTHKDARAAGRRDRQPLRFRTDQTGAPLTACVHCHRDIEPEPRYFTMDGQPRHMLCNPITPKEG